MKKKIDSLSAGAAKPTEAKPAEAEVKEEATPTETPAEPTKAEEPKTEEPKVEEPVKTEEPKAEEVKPDAPTEEAKPEEPKAEATPAEPTKEGEAAAPATTEAATPAAEGATPAEGEVPAEGEEAKVPDTFENLFPDTSVAAGAPPSWLWWVVLLIFSIVLGIVGYALAQHRLKDWLVVPTATTSPTATATTTAEPTATPTETASATPTPEATATAVTPASVTFRVLNGTTTTGAAGTASAVLAKSGFKARTTGNAKDQTAATTIIYYQTGRKAEAEAVQAALTGYTATLEESTLAAPDMVLVVIGKK